jgi:hypothetical protein
MDQRFVPIYDELSLEFDPGFRVGGRRSRAVYAKADRLAWDAIAEVQRRVAGKKHLRADARLFLISNLALMVTRPLLHCANARAPASAGTGEVAGTMQISPRRVDEVGSAGTGCGQL